MWIRRLSLFVAVALSSSSSSSSFVGFVALGAAETECNAVENDTCSAAESLQPSGRRESSKSTNKHHPTAASQCGLYMAESSIPDSGWGVFLGYNTDSGNQTSAGLLLEEMKDVIVQVADLTQQARWKLELYNITLPYLILADYFWKSIETQSYFDADRIESTSPGLGMLVNAHLGLTNLEQAGCRTRLSGPRAHPTAGATSSYQDCVFVWATTTATASSAAKSIQLQLPPGHELFDDYGDQWFVKRPEMFGDELPLTNDYKRANGIVKLWQQKMERIRQRGSVSEDEDASASIDSMGSALWTTIVRGFGSYLPPRTRRALPLNASDAARIDLWTPTEKENSIFRNHSDEHYVGNTVAYLDVPNVIRSQAWLEDHGLCLDHIRVQPVAIPGRSHERGVVARRFVPAGAVVAPAPVVHLSRKHLEILLVDANGAPTTVLWQGHQLLLNYCYGHPESSVLLFPYSPGVNLINHPDRGESNQIPNVAIRWSKQMAYPEWLQLDALTLLHDKSHAGLMMEFYALRDINPGEDILLDYGNSWQTAWNEHVDAWEDRYQRRSKSGLDLPANVHNFTSAWDYIRQCENSILTDKENDCMYNTPSWIDVRCWIQTPTTLVASKDDNDDDDWLEWRPPENDDSSHRTLDDTLACEILSIDSDGTYRILVQRNSWVDVSAGLEVKKVPRSAIDFVDREYSGNQFMRSAFRHEIRLPEEMVPEAWKDLKSEPDNDCGLFMAESAIPNSGLGIYTSKSIPKGENIYFGEVAVHVEDYHLNTKLRHWAISEFSYNESDWLLDSYYWTPETSKGNFDADDDIQTIIPGFGT